LAVEVVDHRVLLLNQEDLVVVDHQIRQLERVGHQGKETLEQAEQGIMVVAVVAVELVELALEVLEEQGHLHQSQDRLSQGLVAVEQVLDTVEVLAVEVMPTEVLAHPIQEVVAVVVLAHQVELVVAVL
jgi:hypothetical protein